MVIYGLALLFFVAPMQAGTSQSKGLSKSDVIEEAVKTKNDALVTALVENDGNTPWEEKKEASILHWAAATGKKEVVENVLARIRENDGVKSLSEHMLHTLEKPVLLTTFQYKSWVGVVSWSPDGNMLCAASGDYKLQEEDLKGDRTARIWGVKESKVIGTIKHKGGVNKVAWSPDGSMLCTGSSDRTAWIWDVKKGREIDTIKHGYSVQAVAWSPDGSMLCTGGNDSTAPIWDLRGGTLLDGAVHAVSMGGEIKVLKLLLSLPNYANLKGLCNEHVLRDLCSTAS